MEIKIAGKNMALGEALQHRIADGLEGAVRKYFDRPGDAHVTVTREAHLSTVDVNVHLPSGIILQSVGQATDPYDALEGALAKIEKRVRRYKRRLKDHHREDRQPMPSEPATAFVLQSSGESDEEAEGALVNGADHPLTVAEDSAQIRTMTVSEAVMQLELGDSPALMFRNARHNGLNMVYRRPDGHIGWVDPATGATAPA
ncbi:MAG: ribosome-associated translation inhibitor RaiA [Pseudomonadota bacterium]